MQKDRLLPEVLEPVPGAADSWNRVELVGQVVEMDALRLSPAGVPVLGFRIGHRSKQLEAGLPRDVELEMPAKAVGQSARLLAGAKLGSYLRVTGFLALKSAKSRTPVLHVNTIEFVEGMNNGF